MDNNSHPIISMEDKEAVVFEEEYGEWCAGGHGPKCDDQFQDA